MTDALECFARYDPFNVSTAYMDRVVVCTARSALELGFFWGGGEGRGCVAHTSRSGVTCCIAQVSAHCYSNSLDTATAANMVHTHTHTER